MTVSVNAGLAKSSTRSKPVVLPERKRLTPRTTAKKLPWLDSKTGRAVIPKYLDGQNPSGVDSCSPSPSSTSRKEPAVPATKPIQTTKPTVPQKSSVPATERRTPSTIGSSPSPQARYRLSQTRHASLVPKTSSPLRAEHRPFVPKSHEPQKRLSIVGHNGDDNTLRDRSLYEVRPRVGSLAPVPDHLEQSITPESIPIPIVQDTAPTPPPILSRVQISPTQPAANRTINNAVEDLEDMVQEAVDVARDTANRTQVEKIYGIIEEARDAIQDVSREPKHLMTTARPLRVSGSESSSSSSLSGYNTPPPVVPKNVLDDVAPDVRDFQRPSVSFDWAYSKQKGHIQKKPSTSSSSSSDGENERGFGTRSDLLLPKLVETAQTAPREHVDFVLRPVAQTESRGRPYQRNTGDPAVRRHRHHHHKNNTHAPQSKPLPQPQDSDSSEIDASLDEEDPPTKAYGTTLSIREQAHTFSLRRQHRRQPIARNWSTGKKRLTATIACINTFLLGLIIGIYAGEVPRLQYVLADEHHIVIIGNAVLYAGLAISTFFAWTLPLLHGRKPYILTALVLALPLQFPQAIVADGVSQPKAAKYRVALLLPRAVSGLVLGFANVNYITTLLDLFGASLQSKNPHQEFVVVNDIRRHGGGMGMWLGIWSWCWIASLAIGFMIGAAIIDSTSPALGFYVVIIIVVAALLLNVVAPETRRAPYRKSVTEIYDRDENYITRRVSRGEVKLHIQTEGPLYWFEEVWAGIKLMVMMLCQPGLLVLALYLGWIFAQINLVIVLLGALLSRSYRWEPRYVGAGVMSIAIGGLLAIPLTKARIFSRERKTGFRTDSMTFQKQVTWSSHLVRRAIFTLTLPLMGLAYTVSSAGRPQPYMVPIVFAGAVGFLSILAIAECHGLMMEAFDTCDLQPGVNTRHRLQSMAVQDRRRRTNYSSFPRVTAGIFLSQIFGFILAAVATLVGGNMVRQMGAQISTGVTAAILLGLTLLLIAVLYRFKEVQVIPNHTFGTRRDTAAWQEFKELEKMGRGNDWKAVVIGNPSGKFRRVNVLELGRLSRWTEIRKLNFLIKGTMLGQPKEGPRGIVR